VYILAGKSGVLYIGMTNNLSRRVQEHNEKNQPSFTRRYNITKLVWFEPHAGAAKRHKAREAAQSLETVKKDRSD
jgi:predicted GIY-YIG superfamily endonuclease